MMKKIIDGRGTGKTSRLLLIAKENDGVIVCSNPEAAREKAYRYGITGIDFISYIDYCSKQYKIDIEDRRIYIDELSAFLQFLDGRISGYSEDEQDEDDE